MFHSNASAATFTMPDGESAGPVRTRPIDLAHLTRQTMGDRELEREVLRLFVQQALATRTKIAMVTGRERLLLAHNLKGSARGVGAFAIAECIAALEESPEDRTVLDRLEGLIEEVRDFVAAIDR